MAAQLSLPSFDPKQALVTTLCAISIVVLSWQIAGRLTAPAAPQPDALETRSHRAEWILAHRTQGAFDLPSRDLDGLPFAYTVRRHPEGGGRQDIMAWGEGDGALLRIVIYRPGQEDGVALRTEQVLRQLGAAAGLPFDTLMPVGLLATKFGDLPLADATLVGPGAGRGCLAAGDMFPGTGILVAGMACSAGPELVDRKRLACWMDRLVLLSAGGHDALAAFFARSELQRTDACGDSASRPPVLPSRANWLNPRHEPKLRGRLALR